MKMAKASEEEMERSIVLSGMLLDVDGGDFPRGINGERDENDPDYFDVDDPEHLRAFHDRVMGTMAGIHRVTWGFHTLMHNDIVDPDLDVLELHPRIVAALATEEEAKPVPEDQRSIAEQLVATPGRIEYCSAETDLPADLWQVGDIVSRDGNDEQEILDFAGERDFISVQCVKEPPVSEGLSEPWCRLGDLETNLIRRYSFVRPGLRAVTSTPEVREDKDQPLQCGVEDDRLVISIGVDTLAFADKVRTGLNINDPTGFAGDVVRMLTHEDEIGFTLLSGLLDTAMQAVADDGSEFIDFRTD